MCFSGVSSQADSRNTRSACATPRSAAGASRFERAMEQVVAHATKLRGTLAPPGDKSISHRAAMFGAIAAGVSLVEGFLPGDDCLSTLHCLESMGVTFEREPSE